MLINKLRLITNTLYFFILAGCATTETLTSDKTLETPQTIIQKSDWSIKPFGAINFQDFLQLTPEQESEFLTYYNESHRQHITPRRRLYNYLDVFLTNFNYKNNTLTSSEALATKSGNCMSLAMLTTSLAQVVDLDIGYQILNGAPLYYKQSKTVVVSQHIRTKIYAKAEEDVKDGVITFGRAKLVIDYYKNQIDLPGRHIDDKEFMSLYFANLTADALNRNNIEQAYQYSASAMSIFPDSAKNINNHAVILKRLGEDEKAIKLLSKGFDNRLTSLNSLSNYKLYLKEAGNLKQLALVEDKLSYIKDTNPYSWLEQGKTLYANARFRKALYYYSEAEKLAPYLDEIYLAKAKVYFKMNKLRLAEEELKKALAAPIKVNDIKLYEAKLAAFEAPTIN